MPHEIDQNTRLWYVALPYTHKDVLVVQARVNAFCELDAYLNEQGVQTISPILKQLILDRSATLPSSWEFWKTLSYRLLKSCDALLVYQLAGWESSTGVQAEIAYAKECGLPIVYAKVKTPKEEVCAMMKEQECQLLR